MTKICKRRYSCFYIIGTPILLGGIIVYGIYDKYDLYHGIVIKTEYQKTECFCNIDCSKYSQDGCLNYCQDNENFECSQLNIDVLIKENTQCTIKYIDKGFDDNNVTWYNSEYSIHYTVYDVGDSYNIYYNKKCISVELYNSHMSNAIVCIVFGSVLILISCRLCCNGKHKAEIVPNKKGEFFNIAI